MAKKVTQVEIAEALSISKSRVTQYKKKGMPVDSIAAASKWYAFNCEEKKKNKAEIVAAEVVEEPSLPVGPVLSGGANTKIEEELARLKMIASAYWAKSQESKRNNDWQQFDLWNSRYLGVVKEAAVIEEKITSILENQKRVIDVDEVRAVFVKIVQALNVELDRLPKRIAEPFRGENKVKCIQSGKRHVNLLKERIPELEL